VWRGGVGLGGELALLCLLASHRSIAAPRAPPTVRGAPKRGRGPSASRTVADLCVDVEGEVPSGGASSEGISSQQLRMCWQAAACTGSTARRRGGAHTGRAHTHLGEGAPAREAEDRWLPVVRRGCCGWLRLISVHAGGLCVRRGAEGCRGGLRLHKVMLNACGGWVYVVIHP